MSRIKGKNTSIEVRVRSALHRKGLRFRKHDSSLPGSPDIVFKAAKVAIFLDGDFWHGNKFSRWKAKLSPKWRDKIQANKDRDTRNRRKLRRQGWRVIRVWESEIKTNFDQVVEMIARHTAPKLANTGVHTGLFQIRHS